MARGRAPARTAGTVRLPVIDNLSFLSQAELRRLAEAGAELAEIARVLAKTGDNVVGELLRAERSFYEWDHYPPGDVHDPESGAQYYYHAHAKTERGTGEHGHFHAFVRTGDSRDPAPCHLAAIAMTDAGEPFRLFTVNRWVTGETWRPAREAVALLDRFRVELVRPSWVANRWVGACLALFRPQVVALIETRDRVLAAWHRRHPDRDLFEDRSLEVLSAVEVDVASQVALVQRALAKPARRRTQ
jgi:hypothetical protein